MAEKSLGQRIADISASVKKVRMTGKGDGYNFLTIQDVVNAVHKKMQAANLGMSGTVRTVEHHPDGRGLLASVMVDWTIYIMDGPAMGNKFTISIPGDGWGEKGIYKALTGSRKYAIIFLFNLAIGDNPEAAGVVDRKETAKQLGAAKVAEFAANGNDSAIEAMSQAVPEKRITIERPEDQNGNYIVLKGYTAVPQLEEFLDANKGKRSRKAGVTSWLLSSDYEKGFVKLCRLLEIEVG